MKLMSGLLFGGAIVFGAVASGAYAQGFQGGREAMEKACSVDMSSLCAGKTGREAGECLRGAGDKVSAPCKDALSKMGGPGGGGAGGAPGGGAPGGPGGGRGPAGAGPGGFGGPGAGGAARPPRAPPSEGGTVGKVESLSPGSIEITMSSGQKATVLRSSHTTYGRGAGKALGSSIKEGETVLVIGIVQDIQGERKTSIDASLVVAQPVGIDYAPAASGAAAPPQRGAPPAEKRVGQIPSNYVEGEGTIVGPAEADKAIPLALAAFPNGIINRVVKLSDGTYECHHVGVTWPHHVFISKDLKYLGAF